MKRVLIIGCPGSGKSTLALALHRKTGLPLCHLDMLYWNADKTTVEQDVFRARLAAVLAQEAWIIDGNFSSTMEWRLAACDTVVFLDYPEDVCLSGVRERRGKPRTDMPWIEIEEDAEFTRYIQNFRAEQRPAVMSLLEKYAEKTVIILKDRAEADAFLEQVRV